MSNSKAEFGVVDYCVFIATLAVTLGIGLVSAFRKQNNSPEDFLLGGRALKTIPVALSLLTTFISAVNIIGFAGEIYAYGTQLCMAVVGAVLGIGLATVLTMPVLYPLKMTSVNEYIERRFKSIGLRLCVMVLTVLLILIFMGIVIYASSIALAAVTPLSYVTNAVLISVIFITYSTLGGIRAVVWTDVFQFTVMVVGLCILIVVGTIEIGGISNVYTLAREGGRLQLFNMNPAIYERHTFFNTIALGFSYNVAIYGVSQANFQRICCVPTFREAKKVMIWNIIGTFIVYCLMFATGIVAYAAYAGCDPISEGKIHRREQIITYYIVDKLGYLTGLSGIFVASLTASTLSTLSSSVNTNAALIWKDLLSRLKIFASAPPKTATLINKFLTCLVGLLFLCMAFIISKAQSIIQLAFTIGSLIYGVTYGIFLLGIFVPRSTAKGAWSGSIVSFVLSIWIYGGSLMYRKPPKHLPYSTEFCFNNATESLTDLISNFDVESVINSTMINEYTEENDNSSASNFPLMYLYGISYTWYPLISPLICLLVGAVVSYATGPLKPEEVELHLISPILRKFYATRSQRCSAIDDGMKLTEVENNPHVNFNIQSVE